ncbi:MAG: TonB-dependent receptor [Deltaproteobacteria bacterium]|nr:MAG: TonB-dependent receptor [Deltaproteobacteria bacterium]
MPFLPATRSALALFALAGLWAGLPLAAPRARAEDAPARSDAEFPATDANDLPVVPVGEVNVTATRAERGALEVPGNVTVIDREAIERSGAQHAADLLRREAGIYVTNTSGTPSGYAVDSRGFNNGGGNGSSTLVLVDGRRVNETDSSTPDWALLHVDRIERIEIVRGPTSAVWGDNAIGGVIQIITRSGSGAPTFSWTERAGTYDFGKSSLYVGGEEGPIALTFFGETSSTDGYRDHSSFETDTADGKLRWTIDERAALEVSGGYTSDQRDFPGTLTKREERCFGRRAADPNLRDDEIDAILAAGTCADVAAAARPTDTFADVRARYLQGRLDLELADAVALHVQPSYRRRNQANRDSGRTASGGFFTFALDREAVTSGVNARLQIDRSIGDYRNRILVGTDYLYEKVDSGSLSVFDGFPSASDETGRRRIYGVFAQEELNLTDDLLLSAGLRFDHARYENNDRIGTSATVHSTFDFWSPKAALTYRVREPLSVYASFARGFRFPNFDEAFGFFGFVPELDPERSKSYEVGAKFRDDRASANLALYQMDVKDEILFDHEFITNDPASCFPAPPCASPRNVNFDRVRHRGLEFSANLRPLEWLELYGSYTYDDTEIRRDSLSGLDGNRLPITPRHRGTYGVRLFLPYGVELWANANVVGSRLVANDLENLRQPKLRKFSVYDLTATFRPEVGHYLGLGDQLEVALQGVVRNVTDREYTEFGGQGTFDPTTVGFDPSPTRNYEVGITVTYRLPTER